jgi:two-component system CheB/CheR fusion protein
VASFGKSRRIDLVHNEVAHTGVMPRQRTPPAPTEPRGVVGLGASAGGMDALSAFLGAVPAGGPLAYIVVQHLGHARSSALTVLLRMQTTLPVVEASDGLAIEAGRVYVIPPSADLTVQGGRLRVRNVRIDEPSAQQVDHLFVSLAEEFGACAVGVVLSGMGSDGTEGLRAILDRGGSGYVQSPESARFDSMPRSAAAIGRGVTVAEPAQMPARILAALGVSVAAQPPPADEGDALAHALHHLAAVSGHDFSPYKTSTLKRRIERRMAIHSSASMDDYVRLLGASTQEAELLFKEMLIGVTAFFRDPALWDAVAASVLPALVARLAGEPRRQFRAWVVGCSTGEEAYTLAMLLREALDALPDGRALAVQIFATDLSADAVLAARRGVYPDAIRDAVSAPRLARFFVAESGGWRVAKPLREMVLFARHDVISDPPFSRVDLVSCRNLLIYFNAALQQRLLPLFHYVLQPGGVLLLGNAETLGRAESLFEPVDAKLRIYRRNDGRVADASLVFPARSAARAAPTPQESAMSADQPPQTAPIQAQADRLMLDEFAPPAVLVNADGDILYVSGRTGRFLEPAAGKANWNVHAMARAGLRPALGTALRQARLEGRTVEEHGIDIEPGDADGAVDLAVRPVQLAGQAPLLLVVFRDAAAAPAAPVAKAGRVRRGSREAELKRLHEQMVALREEMRSSQEELQSSNEELQSTNEELQSTNEELQSANEELTTSKEEIQAMNEELQTVNAELLSRLEDLAEAQADLKNLLNSTQIATLFLDGAMNVRRFTEQAKKLINLRESDVGRPLTDLTTSLDYPALLDDVATVLRTLEFCEKSVPTHDGRWYTVRVMPYRTLDSVIDGAVITFVDITVAKALEARLTAAGQDKPA